MTGSVVARLASNVSVVGSSPRPVRSATWSEECCQKCLITGYRNLEMVSLLIKGKYHNTATIS